MTKRILVLSVLLVCLAAQSLSTKGWNNGGYSDDPNNPKYATHDWIAQHALDWLPQVEKQPILDNLQLYLYGTELPDNNVAPDHIGDTGRHHVYYFRNGSVQEDDAAVRAQQEYESAVNYILVGDAANATKRLGVMTHYIADVACYAHVMGNRTEWGNATHHGTYEDHVETGTNLHTDDFNVFIAFDGALTKISAYNATMALAYDTTFDGGNTFNCTWMEQNYNWNNPDFLMRCGESLNLAVNAITDVLHTFYLETATDSSAPVIDIPTQFPPRDSVMPSEDVTVTVNITDTESGVKNATVYYEMNDDGTWIGREMSFNVTSQLYLATIPGQSENTLVRFKIVAYDNSENNASRDGPEIYFTYQVVPELSMVTMLILIGLFSLTLICIKAMKLEGQAPRSAAEKPDRKNGRIQNGQQSTCTSNKMRLADSH